MKEQVFKSFNLAGESCSSVAVEWQPPQKANGCPVLGYRVQMCSSRGRSTSLWSQVWAGEDLQCKVISLQVT